LAGRYCVKGKGHFVIIEQQQHTRWVFVPPNARANAKNGHNVTARVTQHPYQTGKAQARVLSDIGNETNVNAARQFTLALYQLFDGFGKDVCDQARSLKSKAMIDATETLRSDLRSHPFVTIDSANTRDMDDALTVESTDNGWKLRVAIADPSSEIAWESPIDHIALLRAHTVYLPGKPVPMLPEELSTDRYSLLAGQDRLALVATLEVDGSGHITDYSFESAIVQSKAKLSYQQVSALFNGEDFTPAPQLNDAIPFTDQLNQLKQCATALHAYRKEHQLVGEYRPDFMLLLNKEGKLDSIEKIEKSDAHLVVEEAMLACNQCAGAFLAEHKAGIYMAQSGYRDERRNDIEKLLKESIDENKVADTADLNNYLALIKQLQQHPDGAQLMAKQQRFQQASELSLVPAPHFGLGKNFYATITSPIRRYQDLYNHRIIHALIENKKSVKLRHKQLERLKETITNNRNASRVMEQWLIADYLQSKVGETFIAYIALLTNQGIGVRLVDTGVEGFIVSIKESKSKNKDDAKAKEKQQAGKEETKENSEVQYDKISFNNQRMELTWNNTPLLLEQEVEVKLVGVDMEKKKPIFEWLKRPV
ncbi:MAG: exoribonuclease-2/ribonuclease R, partial [Cellvibrionaceae bacterium]